MARRSSRRFASFKARTGRTMKRQFLLCILILLMVIGIKKANVAFVQKAANEVKLQFTHHVSIGDIGLSTKSALGRFRDGTIKVVATLAGGDKRIEFANPSDIGGSLNVTGGGGGKTVEFHSEKEIQVYAAAGGTVSDIGNDAEGNKYLKIHHTNDLSSIYGGCTSTYVKALDKVKKGQLIGSVAEGEEHVLRFEIWSEGKLTNPADYINFE